MIHPELKQCDSEINKLEKSTLLIVSEGYEVRALNWMKSQDGKVVAENSILFRNIPEKKSGYLEAITILENITSGTPMIIDYHRSYPHITEKVLNNEMHPNQYSMIVIDITVMSKMLIMILINLLKDYSGHLRIIFTEPVSFAPTFEEFSNSVINSPNVNYLPTTGVADIVRTPNLTSVSMQNKPNMLIAFLSYNEALILELLSSMSPSEAVFINGFTDNQMYRKAHMTSLHSYIIEKYKELNPIEQGVLQRKSSEIQYQETVELLTNLYSLYCLKYRVVVSPTGSQMQALACALVKAACQDIHIEYPRPEKYRFENFTSGIIRRILCVDFENFQTYISALSEDTLDRVSCFG